MLYFMCYKVPIFLSGCLRVCSCQQVLWGKLLVLGAKLEFLCGGSDDCVGCFLM